jgi:2-dehydro-3-deoxyphosphogluconate aldolase/(4S)-4-hydroxy-2-oxoglutarate aldolase
MANKPTLFEHLRRNVIVGVVREDDAVAAWNVALAYAENGLRTIEITLTTPDAISLIERLNEKYAAQGLVLAAGTIRNTNQAAEARRAGARMLVSPHTDVRVIDYAIEHDLLCVAGAATATEIIHAWEAGADVVKVFPAPQLGGAEYIRTIRMPIRDIPLLAGGPVSLEAIDSYLDAGAIAVNLGGSLALPPLVAQRSWEGIGKRVTAALEIVRRRTTSADDASLTIH